MTTEITFTKRAWADYQYWKDVNDQEKSNKIDDLIKEISRTPYKGTGKPEPLKHIPKQWSRRIDKENRLLYEIIGKTLKIYQCKGHY